MSITFSVKDAAYHMVFVECCVCTGTGQYLEAPCPYCGGTGKSEDMVCELPEVNMANTNAYDLIRALGEEPDSCGEWPLPKLGTIMTKLMLLKCGITSVYLETETVRENNIIHCGRDSEYVMRRASSLYEVVWTAHRLGRSVVWG